MNVSLYGKMVFGDLLEDVEMRSSWSDHVSPESNDMRNMQKVGEAM